MPVSAERRGSGRRRQLPHPARLRPEPRDEHSRLQAELHELYVRDEQRRGEWIAGGRVGLDPGEAADTRALNAKINGMADELAAARRVLPAKEALHRDAITKLQTAQTERAAAVADVAVEGARAHR